MSRSSRVRKQRLAKTLETLTRELRETRKTLNEAIKLLKRICGETIEAKAIALIE